MDLTPNAAAPAGDLIKDSNMSGFMADVIKPSMQVPVLVDFWAPWCGPCKTLGPALERIVQAQGGKVRLVKVNIDEPENQPLAQQLRIQSIPAVYAFYKGQPVDGFVGALPESQLKQFVQGLMGGKQLAADPIETLIEEAKAALEQGDYEAAADGFEAVLQQDPAHAQAAAGLARALLGFSQLDEAKAVLDSLPADKQTHAEVQAARSAIQVAEEASAAAGELGAFEAAVAANPGDHQARFDLATALLGANRREEAAEALLEIFRRDRKWNDEAARKQLVKLFEAWGPTDQLTIDTRRRLSTLMFA
ncbi:MAG: co-chaperone YbbN [Alphaproteobacteria bacterium]|jgi:putative thioredoxin|nr:co-chaperone YbbN [Alphaproteobacteria bacterium]